MLKDALKKEKNTWSFFCKIFIRSSQSLREKNERIEVIEKKKSPVVIV